MSSGRHHYCLLIKEFKEFYDPHPCFVGALFAIPMEVAEIAHKLNGQIIPVHEAMNRIRAVTSGGVFISTTRNYIGLEVYYTDRPYDVRHAFCVIKFR